MGSTDATTTLGLAPVLLGIGAIIVVCAVPWFVRLMQRTATAESATEEETFDPDAALARYLARQPTDDAAPGETVAVRDFGRKSA